jgi:hypothetical protein
MKGTHQMNGGGGILEKRGAPHADSDGEIPGTMQRSPKPTDSFIRKKLKRLEGIGGPEYKMQLAALALLSGCG